MTPCIETSWRRDPDGYGRRRLGNKDWRAHRYAWVHTRGPIPQGMHVLHHCDNPPCIRVTPLRPDGTPDPDDHLFLGTQADNLRDAARKGRTSLGGARPAAKLTEADVLTIRERIPGGEAQAAIARDLGVSKSAINQAWLGNTWKLLDATGAEKLARGELLVRLQGERAPLRLVGRYARDGDCAAPRGPVMRGESGPSVRP